MSEIKINDIPVATSAEFTDNDLFLILDDGKARLLQRTTFQAWMRQNVQGAKGDSGVAGKDGRDGVNGINGTNGSTGLSAYQVAKNEGFIGTQTEWVTSLKGATGASGLNGANGWSPVIVLVSRGTEQVLQLKDWIGGTGTKPSTLGYIGDGVIVSNIVNAVNVKGDTGLQGLKGDVGAKGETGATGISVKTISINSSGQVIITKTDDTNIVSNTPNKLTGWASYKDSQYTEASPFSVSPASQLVIPNNSETTTTNLPTGVSSFYNKTSQKMLLVDTHGLYSIRVRLKVKPLSTSGFVNISFSKDTTEIPFSVDLPLRGDSLEQDVNVSTIIYGDESIVANGLSARIKTFATGIQIYNVEFVIVKVV